MPLQVAAMVHQPGHHIFLLATAAPDNAATAQLRQLVDSKRACLAVSILPADLLTSFEQASAAVAKALDCHSMPTPQAVAVLSKTGAAVQPALQALPATAVHSVQSMHSTADTASAAATAGTVSARDTLVAAVTVAAAEAIGFILNEEGEVSLTDPLMDAGLNSTGAVQLVSLLEATTGLELPGTLAFDYPSIAEITDYLLSVENSNSNTACTAGTAGQLSMLPKSAIPTDSSTSVSVAAVAVDATQTQVTGVQSSAAVTDAIVAAVRTVLGLTEEEDLDLNCPLMDAGLNSSLAIELTSQLETLLHRDLPGTLVFDYPTITEIITYLTSSADSSSAPMPVGSVTATPSAVVTAQLGDNSQGASTCTSSAAANLYPPHMLQGTVTSSKAGVLQQPGHKSQGAVTTAKAEVLLSVVTAAAADMIGEVVNADTPLMDAGLTSATAIQMTSTLEEALGVDLPGTLVFDYPTVSSLVAYLAECDLDLDMTDAASSSASATAGTALVTAATDRVTAAAGGTRLFSPTGAGALPVVLAPRVAPNSPGPIAIVATAHRVPGGCLQPSSFAEAVDRISAVPLDRWDANEAPFDSPSELNAAFGSFLKSADEFDPAAFHLSGSEAVLMDPQQRLLLECFAEALSSFSSSNSSNSSDSSNNSSNGGGPNRQQFGLYVGVSQLEYARITYETGSNLNAYYATGAHLSVVSGRIAYTFGLKGPALAGEAFTPTVFANSLL